MPRFVLVPALLLFAATATASDLQIRVPGTYPGKILIGQRTSVSFEIRNDGSETARDVRVVVNVTPPLLDPTLRNGFGQPCTSTGECNMPALGAGMNSFVVVSGLRTTPGPVTVTATVFAANDPNDRNNTATHVFQFVDETELDLAIQGLDRHIDLEPEQQTDVTVLVMNRGSTIATEVVLTMAFSAGTKVLGAGGDAFDCDVAVTPVVCRAASIPVTGFEWKNSVTFQIVTPPLYDGGSMTAEATIDAKEVDFIPASNREQVTANILEFFTVTNTEDAGPGSLRQAILDANAARCASRCGVGLRIQAPLPEDGFHTIRPRAPLPPLRFDGTLRGST
ncbi:MAG TPA: hypothetical protein VHK90_09870, partial [Thermoanaerobaculia bacterium]|nr:hypothetical protein [Thermoanaerobaculia bacterium]